jgi:PA domain/LVIVD repeat
VRSSKRFVLLSLVALIAVWLPTAATAGVAEATSTFTYTKNMHPLGFSERAVPLTGTGSGIVNSDLAFWGKMAIQGTYEGFRLIDISDPENPVQIVNYTDCVRGTTTGNQGDIVVWDDVLVRSWNSPAPAGGAMCGGILTPAGQEGLHVFDISDPANPVAKTFVATPCGSHTASGVPDLANGRLLVYNNPSSGNTACRGVDIVSVPLANPAGASYLRFESSGDNPLGGGLENIVTVNPPSTAAGAYGAAGAAFGPAPTATGVSGAIVVALDPADAAGPSTTDGCSPLTNAAAIAGNIAVVDRGSCNFTVKVKNAQNAGAVGVIVVNNVPGDPGLMGGADPTITIPAVQVSQADGATIKAGLPATGRISSNPRPSRSCHDTGVILGSVNLAACAGGNGFTVWSIGAPGGGSLTDPLFLYQKAIPGVSIGHSASFTWDGEILIFGHEPGGGSEARCQATSAEVDRTLFFFAARTGEAAGTFLHPRPQTATENCTWHNYNVVPTNKRYVLVSGNYQSGISVLDFTDPANAEEIAFADPAPLSATSLIGGGDWSSYWYDGRIYESDMKRGLIIWNLSDNAVAGAKKLGHLNPQTQETSFSFKGTGR